MAWTLFSSYANACKIQHADRRLVGRSRPGARRSAGVQAQRSRLVCQAAGYRAARAGASSAHRRRFYEASANPPCRRRSRCAARRDGSSSRDCRDRVGRFDRRSPPSHPMRRISIWRFSTWRSVQSPAWTCCRICVTSTTMRFPSSFFPPMVRTLSATGRCRPRSTNRTHRSPAS